MLLVLVEVDALKVEDEHDTFISLVEQAVSLFSISAAPGSFLVNVVPFRAYNQCKFCLLNMILMSFVVKYLPEWFPGAAFQKLAKRGRSFSQAMLNDPHDATKSEVVRFRFILHHRPLLMTLHSLKVSLDHQ